MEHTKFSSLPSMTFSKELPWDLAISHTFKYILPVNLFLSVFILLQNSMILVDYYPDRKKLVISLFMLIAVLDMTVAFGTVLEAIPAIICLVNSKAKIRTNLWYFPIAGTSYIVSVFANAVLSVTKTISIRDPFARVNRRAIILTLIGVTGFWVIFAVAGFTTVSTMDIQEYPDYYNPYVWTDSTLCSHQWDKIIFPAPSFMSFAFISLFKIDTAPISLIYGTVETVAFGLPCIAVFVCMFIQIVYIRRYLSSTSEELDESPDSNRHGLREAHHVNVTVFSISILFVICTFYHSPLIPLLLDYVFCFDEDQYIATLSILSQYTLPLINAAVFPLIIILRKPSLRQKYRERLVRVFTYPVYIWYKYCGTQPGYETL